MTPMAEMDKMPQEWRRLVHEYNMPKVKRLFDAGFSAQVAKTQLQNERDAIARLEGRL